MRKESFKDKLKAFEDFNPNKVGLFEGSFFWGAFIFQKELI